MCCASCRGSRIPLITSVVNLDCAFLNALVFNVLRIGSGLDLLGPLPFGSPLSTHNIYILKFLGGIDDGSPRYSGTTGFIYIFNLIVGTGALTLPAAFHDAGWALGTAVIVALAFMSYLTTTFVIEAMAAANAMQNFKRYPPHFEADLKLGNFLEILLTLFRAQRLKRSEGSLSESRSQYQSNNMNGANSGVDREREPLISSGGPSPDAQDGTTSDDEDPSGVASILFCLLFITKCRVYADLPLEQIT